MLFTGTEPRERRIFTADIGYLVDVSGQGFEIAEGERCQESIICKGLFAASNDGENNDDDVQQAEDDSESITATNIRPDSWPFDWTSIDILGSPGLSRLFKRLEIEAVHVLALSLDGSESEYLTCLSKMEIQYVFNCGKTIATTELHRARLSLVQTFNGHLEGRAAYEAPHFPWRNTDDVFCGYSESPLREIYVFAQQKVSAKPPNSEMTRWAQLQTQQGEVESKYAKLKMHLSGNHIAAMAMMEELASIFYSRKKFTRAEPLYRELVLFPLTR